MPPFYPFYPTLLQASSKAPPTIPPVLPTTDDFQVLDEPTFRTIEVEKLFEALNHTSTRVGQSVLYRSLAQPLAQLDKIKAKQAAFAEIASKPELRQALEKLVDGSKKGEKHFYDLVFGTFLGALGNPAHNLEIGGFGYESYEAGTRFFLRLVAHAQVLPQSDSPYLNTLLNTLRDFSNSRAYDLMKGPVYRSEKDILTRKEKRWYIPTLKFRPSLFKPRFLIFSALAVTATMAFLPLLDIAFSLPPLAWLFIMPLGLTYIPIVGNMDRDGFIYPLRKIFKESPEVQASLDALGHLDELLSFVRYSESFGHPTTLPTLSNPPQHFLEVHQLRNPILGKDNPNYVGNDLTLNSERLAFVTGPNSGGKTAFCKTLAQTQLMAQIGSPVPASSAKLAIADHIYYQTPEISHLDDGEGRFGTELKRTKAVFMTSSARSLVIMDELSEGTTHEEKIEISTDILNGFRQKGATTLLITHNHDLVEHFQAQKIGLARQAEFKDENPTYRIIEGISKVSHADRVAKKIGFSRDDIARMLRLGS